jgi:hypothetical protein
MQRREFMKLGAGLVGAASGLGLAQAGPAFAAGAKSPGEWKSLFKGRDLSGWYSVLNKSGRGVAEKTGLVTVEEGMLHMMGNVDTDAQPEIGYISTEQEYENVHLLVEFKWGMKRFNPRRYVKRDNGILYGLQSDKVWPPCVELQIEEGDVGDAILVGGQRGIQAPHYNGLIGMGVTSEGFMPADVAPKPYWGTHSETDHVAAELKTNHKFKEGNFEKLDDWNTLELIWQGDKAAHIVNSRCVNVVTNIEYPDPANPGRFLPLKRGRIALEIEYAETWFRRVDIRSLG